MHSLNKNKAGLAVGMLFGLIHLVWAIMVGIGLAKPFMDWIFHLHFMDFTYTITPFGILTALWLVVVTAIIGYVFGWVVAALWNWLHKESHMQ